LGKDEPPLSIVRDDLGIYYDATAPSRLEILVGATLNPGQSARTQSLIAAWREARVSKYNHARDFEGNLPKPYVLLADQVAGDVSIKSGLADSETFQRMLAAALQDNPACTILVKIHPDVLRGKNQGHFDLAQLALEARVQVLAENVHPVTLIENAEAVYCVTSQIGFEGLLWGKRVHTFGMPFYAGWGLTCDALPAPERRQIATLEVLVHAALIAYPSYLDPETQQICEPERLLAWLGLQRRMRGRFPAIVHAVGFSDYKKPIVRRFCQGSEVIFTRELSSTGTQIVWGRNPEYAKNAIQLEDGFIRSGEKCQSDCR
jgi:capsular polysaccharide export protein